MRKFMLVALVCASASPVHAQSLAKRVTESDGTVQIVYPSHPDVCGDGSSYVTNVFGRSRYYTDGAVYTGRGDWNRSPCVRGPARVVATVMSGEVTRLRAYVGPVPSSGTRTIDASVA